MNARPAPYLDVRFHESDHLRRIHLVCAAL
jgi:hypothetical protein